MSTYLQLCKDTARESGTVAESNVPETVIGQTGRFERIVYWVRDAYSDVQTQHAEWRWLEADFTGQTTVAVREYDPAALGISSRFSRWIHDVNRRRSHFSIYDPMIGQSDESTLPFVPWETFRLIYMVGSSATEQRKPSCVTVTPDDRLAFYPIPDATYTVRGRYRKSPQILVGDDDIPEMPEEFHQMIKWKALLLLGNYDEAQGQMGNWQREYLALMGRLQLSQLPQMTVGGPLA